MFLINFGSASQSTGPAIAAAAQQYQMTGSFSGLAKIVADIRSNGATATPPMMQAAIAPVMELCNLRSELDSTHRSKISAQHAKKCPIRKTQ
jgi:hypothetical protein